VFWSDWQSFSSSFFIICVSGLSTTILAWWHHPWFGKNEKHLYHVVHLHDFTLFLFLHYHIFHYSSHLQPCVLHVVSKSWKKSKFVMDTISNSRFFVSYDHSSFWSPRHIHPIFWSRFPSFFLTIHLLHQFPAGSFSFSSTHSKSDIHLMTFGSPEQEKTADKKKMTYLLGNIVRHEKRTTRRTVSRKKSV